MRELRVFLREYAGVGVLVLGLVCVLAAVTLLPRIGSVRDDAERYLHRFYQGSPIQHVECEIFDVDNNGYLSCDAVVGSQQVSLECPRLASCNSACRRRSLGASSP